MPVSGAARRQRVSDRRREAELAHRGREIVIALRLARELREHVALERRKLRPRLDVRGGDPFENLSEDESPSCKLTRYPTSRVPLMVVHRACDALVACDEPQRQLFALPPGIAVGPWIDALARQVRDPNVQQITLDRFGQRRFACAAPSLCSQAVGLRNHLAWPNGIADGSGVDWETEMLRFLGAQSL